MAKREGQNVRRGVAAVAIAGCAGVGLYVWLTHGPAPAAAPAPRTHAPRELAPPEAATFVGSQACRACHAAEFTRWSGSQHARAMQAATPEHVLAQLDAAAPDSARDAGTPGVAARYFRDDAGLHVEAEGPDGGVQQYDVSHTFGVAPLQQYLAPFPGGRWQALPVAWDSRTPAQQGQRWLQLYPDVRDHRDQLHWTGPYQNWNMMCAECHVTGFVKAYAAEQDAYASRFSELGVGCEACHGPGSVHVGWAQAGTQPGYTAKGFVRDLKARGEFRFATPEARIASRVDAPSSDPNAECAACHARAGTLVDAARSAPRAALTQHHRPTLLLPPEYWPSGEQRDEVFVWASFAASKMAARGVTCGDCHEPHSGAPLAADNALCVRCHQPTVFDTPLHHHHAQGGEGARCVDCHMARERYMVVDPRRDHSFQLPRPDLSAETGSPNACNRCHAQRDHAWAAAQLDRWFGGAWRARPHRARAFASAGRNSSAAQRPLAELALDRAQPAIVRASALRLWRDVPRALPDPRLFALVDDAEPLVRSAALPLLERSEPAERWRRARAHLADEDRLVRLEAAELLCGLPPELTGQDGAARLQQALAELTRSLEQQSDFPANAAQLGQLYLRQRDLSRARRWFEHALARDPQFQAAYARLSELHRLAGDQAASLRVLEQGLARLPQSAELSYASGLALVRLQRKEEALARLARAAELAPNDAGIAYTYAVALQDQGQLPRAIEALERTLRTQPENGELLEELLRIGLASHTSALILRHLPAFERLFPDDPSLPLLRAAAQAK